MSKLKVDAYSNPAISTISMLCGDINEDHVINSDDIAIINEGDNYYKSVDNAANPTTDLNGDNVFNSDDSNVIYRIENYDKSVADCTFAY